MQGEECREHLQALVETSPNIVYHQLVGPSVRPRIVPGPPPSFCKCGHCLFMDKPKMNFCCEQDICVTFEPTFQDLTKKSVLEVAGIINYCDTFHDIPDFNNSNKYRNSAYRFFILWQVGKLGRHARVCPPACVVARIRQLYPRNDANYTGYESFGDSTA